MASPHQRRVQEAQEDRKQDHPQPAGPRLRETTATSLLQPDTTLVTDEVHLRAYIEAALGGILAVHSDGRIVFMNGHTVQMFGYSRAEIIGQSLTILIPGRFHDSYAAAFRSYFEAPNVRMLGMDLGLIAVRKTGEEFPVEIGLSFVEGQQGTIALGFITDVTERKRALDQLALANAALVRSNKELEHFAQLASHDLQEPLRVITSYLDLIDRRYRGNLNPEAGELLDFVASGAKRMKDQIQNCLSFSHAGMTSLNLKCVQTEAILQSALADLTLKIAERSAEISRDPLPEIVADSSLLAQLFENLIENGIKFQKDRVPRVHISAARQEAEWVFSVRDNGIGIEPQHSQRVFQMFERLNSSAEFPGYGVGLAISQKIVARHGGRIWFESTPGEGSTFFFSIPQAHSV